MRRVLIALPLAAAMAPAIAADATLYRPIPGTPTPDYGSPAWVTRGDTLYPVIPGTQTPDYGSRGRSMVREGKVYRVIPGTQTPDYGSGSYIIRRR